MVVNLTVDGERNGLILVGNGLGARLWSFDQLLLRPSPFRNILTNADNAETLMDQNGAVGDVVSTPIGTAVLDLLAQPYGSRPEFLDILWIIVNLVSGRWYSGRIRDVFKKLLAISSQKMRSGTLTCIRKIYHTFLPLLLSKSDWNEVQTQV